MMTTPDISSQATLSHFPQGSDELRRIVQRFGTAEGDAPLSGVPAEEDVNIVQDFHVVADKPDRVDYHVANSRGGIAVEHRLYRRAQPLVSRHPLALVSEIPIRQLEPFRDRGRGFVRFAIVRVAAGENLL